MPNSDTGLRIGINALYLIPGGVGGTEIYLRSLLGALAAVDPNNHYVVYTNRETGADLVPAARNFSVSAQPVKASFRPGRILWEQLALPPITRRDRLDVLFNPGFTAPLLSSCPTVTVFHDLQHKRCPQHFRWFELPFWQFFLWASARRSTRLLAVSETTYRDLALYYHLFEDGIRVIPHGVDVRFFEIARARRNNPTQPYLLCVSTLQAHKNLDRLIPAFADFRRGRPEFRLVLAGMRGLHTKALEKLVRQMDLGAWVRFTGWIPREELYGLFLHAHAFIYPSSFEGFGMPVLEALAAGIPTACSEIPALAEFVGLAALQFDPLDPAAIRGAMERVASDGALRERLALAGPVRASHYDWKETARSTLKLLKEAAATS